LNSEFLRNKWSEFDAIWNDVANNVLKKNGTNWNGCSSGITPPILYVSRRVATSVKAPANTAPRGLIPNYGQIPPKYTRCV
jgi:hypothetical protein